MHHKRRNIKGVKHDHHQSCQLLGLHFLARTHTVPRYLSMSSLFAFSAHWLLVSCPESDLAALAVGGEASRSKLAKLK